MASKIFAKVSSEVWHDTLGTVHLVPVVAQFTHWDEEQGLPMEYIVVDLTCLNMPGQLELVGIGSSFFIGFMVGE